MLRAICLVIVSAILIPSGSLAKPWGEDGGRGHKHNHHDWTDAEEDAREDDEDRLEKLQDRQEKAQKEWEKLQKEATRELEKWQRKYGRYGWAPPSGYYQPASPTFDEPAVAPRPEATPQPEAVPRPEPVQPNDGPHLAPEREKRRSGRSGPAALY